MRRRGYLRITPLPSGVPTPRECTSARARVLVVRVILHIGPHKTGTTSVQKALLEHVRRGEAGFVYPDPGSSGPGHAEIAWRFIGLNGLRPSPEVLPECLEEAAAAGCRTVVLSSEEFGRALVDGDTGFRPFRLAAEAFEIELVVTMSPLVSRVHAEIQEGIKFGRSFSFYDLDELLSFMSQRPGLRPDFLVRAMRDIRPSRTSVVYTDKSRPEKIYESFSTLVGEPIEPTEPIVNVSLPYLKAAMMNVLNACDLSISWQEARAINDAAFAAAGQVDNRVMEPTYPPLPASFARHLEEMWRAQVETISLLEASGELRVL